MTAHSPHAFKGANLDAARRDAAHFIDGEFTQGATGKSWINRSPLDNSVIGRVPEGGKAEIDAAVRAAKAALHGPWGKMSVAGAHRRCLPPSPTRSIAASTISSRAEMSRHRQADSPRLAYRHSARRRQFQRCSPTRSGVTRHREFHDADAGRQARRAELCGAQAQGRHRRGLPWNLPLLLMTWKVGPALACGNTVVVKPSEETPRTAALLGEVMNEVGVPKGRLQRRARPRRDSAGEYLTSAPDVDGITFTGETGTGEAIMRRPRSNGMRPVSFELGGKNAALVFADCDMDKAIEGTMRSVFANCGQVCLGTERVYVERPIFDQFVERLAKEAQALKLGRSGR
jgi:aminomuconate-semialdehyde/2-hydroxymuconate-6-semialdehyde dehydrogenase